MKAKLNNQGLTLIELVIAITISTVILGAAFMFISGAERAYRKAESGINLQMEGQILMEQIGNWVMESNRIVVSNDGTVLCLFYIPLESSDPEGRKYPTGYEPETKAKCRVIYSPKSNPLDNSEKKPLYMQTVEDIEDVEVKIEEALKVSDSKNFYESFADPQGAEYCISDYVTGFAASVPSGEDSDSLGSVIISLEMEQGREGYHIRDTFSMRNGLYNQFVTPEGESTEASGDGTTESSDEGT